MIGVDLYVLEFIQGNVVSLGLLYVLLKGIAKITTWTGDDQIATLFGKLFHIIKDNEVYDERDFEDDAAFSNDAAKE